MLLQLCSLQIDMDTFTKTNMIPGFIMHDSEIWTQSYTEALNRVL